MKIAHYSYDHVNNPRCGGGGAFRELLIHRDLASRHTISCFCGAFKNSRSYTDAGIHFAFLGFGANYLLSRITFSLFATMHSLFVKSDVIVIGYSVFSPVLTFLFRRKKTVIEFYHLTGNQPFRKYSVFGIFPWLFERIALQFGRYYITLTDSMAELINTRYANKNACAAYTGYDTAIDSTEKSDDNYILYFGRIDIRMKGIDILIDAYEKIASRFPKHLLKIAGRGSEHDITWLKNRIAGSKVKERITFHKNVPLSEKYTLFHDATFVCMPSRFEGWCISAIEAGASSKATLGTQIMGLQDSIKNNETGILVPAEDNSALAEKMTLLLSDKSLRTKLGKNGHQWSQNFTWEKVAKLQENLLRKAAKN